MRALLRAKLRPVNRFIELWDNETEYVSAVASIFRAMGFAIDFLGKEDVMQSEAFKRIMNNTPEEIFADETKRPIMVGYSSSGQAPFLVVAVNPTDLHIRVQAEILMRIENSCAEILSKAIDHAKEQRTPILSRLREDVSKPYIAIGSTINVMEPHRSVPTILGETVGTSFLTVLGTVIRKNRQDVILVLFTLLGSVLLFFSTPFLAEYLSNSLSRLIGEANAQVYNADYIKGALERTYSAFLVTFFVSTLNLATRAFDLWRKRPIGWTASGVNQNA